MGNREYISICPLCVCVANVLAEVIRDHHVSCPDTVSCETGSSAESVARQAGLSNFIAASLPPVLGLQTHTTTPIF